MGNPNQVAKEPEPTIRHIFTAEIIPNQGRTTLSLDIGILPTFSGVQCKQMWIFYALLHLFCLWILCFPTKCIPENIRFASFPHWYGLQCWLQMISREIMFWQQYLWVNSMKEEKKKSIFRVIMWQLFFNSLLKPSAKLQSFHFFFLILICNFNSDKDSNIMSKSKICHYIHLSVPAFCQEDHGLWSKRDSQSKWR